MQIDIVFTFMQKKAFVVFPINKVKANDIKKMDTSQELHHFVHISEDREFVRVSQDYSASELQADYKRKVYWSEIIVPEICSSYLVIYFPNLVRASTQFHSLKNSP